MTRILVIEDDPQIQRNIQEILELEGYEILVANDGAIGVQLAREQDADLIISDLMMPELDGYGVLETLRADSTTNTIPVILLSALTSEMGVSLAFEMGATDYLIKPYMRSQLLDAINQALNLQAS